MKASTDILIIGGGFSGTALAANLANLAPSLRVMVAERAPLGEFGVAYRTQCYNHILNVPAGGMSAFPDRPNDFVDWAIKQGEDLNPKTFAPRALYARYLNGLLEASKKVADIQICHCEATDLSRAEGGWNCTFKDGRIVNANTVVLAFGNSLPILPLELKPLEGHPSLVLDPWAVIPKMRLSECQRVGIVGTGLTAVDVILSLEAQGFVGHYDLISRHGLLPACHKSGYASLDSDHIPPPTNSVRRLLKEFRKSAAWAVAHGSDWRALFDAIRPNVADYWKELDPTQRSRFLRHLRAFWDIHRHRSPAESDQVVQDLVEHRRLSIVKGRLASSMANGKSAVVSVKPRCGDEEMSFSWDLIFNCTGSPSQIKKWSSPLMEALLSEGLAQVDATQMGLLCDDHGSIADSDGKLQSSLYALGMLRRGQLWESTAVPDLRRQALSLAELIART